MCFYVIFLSECAYHTKNCLILANLHLSFVSFTKFHLALLQILSSKLCLFHCTIKKLAFVSKIMERRRLFSKCWFWDSAELSPVFSKKPSINLLYFERI